MTQELSLILGSMAVALITQFAKKIRDEYGWRCDPKFLAAAIAIVGGTIYALFKEFAPDEWLEKAFEFGAMSFAGSIAIYEVFKSALSTSPNPKKPATPEEKFSVSFKESLRKLEESALNRQIDFECFDLSSIERGQRTEDDLKEHVRDLATKLNIL